MLNKLIGAMLSCLGLMFFGLVVMPIIAARTGELGYCIGVLIGLAILGKILSKA